MTKKHISLHSRWWHPELFIQILGVVLLALCLAGPVEAKSKRVSTSPVKISEVVISPEPFLIGKSPVTFSMLVELPVFLNGANVLEVSVLISSPTRRSMSFVAHRQILASPQPGIRTPAVPVVLVWDGKDQYRQLVPDGSYYYEIRAKLMEDEGFGPRTRVVSHRVQGTLDVLAYVGEVLPPVPPEPALPEEAPEELPGSTPEGEDVPLKEEELPVEEVPVVEEGLKLSDEPVTSDESLPKEPGELAPEVYPEALPEIQEGEKMRGSNDPAAIEEPVPDHSLELNPEPVKPMELAPPAH
ncbi:MAG: hypothetical protein R3B74_02600 [Nitrospirales bacterium]|nr:hypothetical protein [Nitrospirales bacterium]